jgi:hypothetical protein
LRNHASIYRSTQVAEGVARSDSFPKMEADFATDFLRDFCAPVTDPISQIAA